MSSLGTVHSKEGDTAGDGTASENSKDDGAGNEVTTFLSDKFASLKSGGGEGQGKERAAAAVEENDDTNIMSKEQGRGDSTGQENGYEATTEVTADSSGDGGDGDTSITSKGQEGGNMMGQGNGNEAGTGVATGPSSREASLTREGGKGKERAADGENENEDARITSSGQEEGGSMGQRNGSQHDAKQETPTSSTSPPPPPPPPTATIADATVVKEPDHPGRRFAKYKLAPQTPAVSTTSRGRSGAGGGGPSWRGGGSRSGGGGGRCTSGGKRGSSDWKNWLWKYLDDPRGSKLEQNVYYEDEVCVAIYDGYPEARYHLLLISKGPPVKQPIDLRREHLPSRRRLHDVGRAISEELSRQGAGPVRCGYHAIPSHEPLHLHIVSQDFDAPRLKCPSHWNSFTTYFFLDCSWVEARLEELGSLELDMKMYERLEHQPMKCHRCGWAAARGMLSIKKHNLECTAPLPGVATESYSKST